MMGTLLQDVRYAARMLVRNPGFSLVAVLTLALGVGANTAIFSVVNGVLLRPLPYPEADRIVTLWQTSALKGGVREPVSPANFLDLRERSRSFERVAALRPYGLDHTSAGEPETFQAWLASEGFFEIMGTPPLHGRTFLPGEYAPGGEPVVVLGHGLWQRRFGGDAGLVGQKITLDGKTHTVVGVMPPEFHLLERRGMVAPYIIGEGDLRRRASNYLTVVARLRPGVTIGQAGADAAGIAQQLSAEHPQTNRDVAAEVVGLHEQIVGRVRPALLVLLGAVGLVLLIACANVASLMLARASARRREFSVRAALGARRWRLARQLLTESALLALAGGALGVLLAGWGIDAILALNPESLPRARDIMIDWRVLAFALGATALTALVFGLAPALQASKTDLSESLKESGRSVTEGRARLRLRNVLVAGELALALMLLVGAGLLARSFARLLQVDPGFAAENALALQVHVYDQYPAPAQQVAFFEQALERIKTLPGVEAAGAVTAPPFVGEGSIEIEGEFTIEGRPAPEPGQESVAYHTIVTADYFRAMGVPVLRGRSFSSVDRADAVPVCVINETMARKYWPGEDSLGKSIRVRRPGRPAVREIVGVVGDVRHAGLDGEPRPEIFLPLPQSPFGSMTFIVRTQGEPYALLPAVKNEVWAVNRNQPFYSTATMEQLVSDSLRERRFSLVLIGAFALVALALSAVGIYGLVSYSTGRRTHEIGVRMALGARPGDIFRMVIGEGLLLSMCGVAAGLAGAWAFTRFMAGMLYGVTPTDPLTFAALALLLLLVALAACALPARRATRVDPMVSLRYE